MTATLASAVDELLRRVEEQIAASHWERACELLADAGSDTRVLDKYAFCLSRAKRYDEAIAVLVELQSREPGEARWPYMLGYQLYAQDRFSEALPHFIAAWRANPRHLRNLYRLAQTRLHLGDADRAMRGATEVLRIWQDLPAEAQKREAQTLARAAYLVGREQLKTDAAAAIEPLNLAVEYDAGDHDKHYLLGKALRKAGRPQDAVESLRHALRIKPGQLYVELELAVALGRSAQGEEEAIRILGALERRLSDWQALKGAALAARLCDSVTARRLLERAARKSFVRGSPAYGAVAEQVKALPAVPEEGDREVAETAVESSHGRVDKIECRAWLRVSRRRGRRNAPLLQVAAKTALTPWRRCRLPTETGRQGTCRRRPSASRLILAWLLPIQALPRSAGVGTADQAKERRLKMRSTCPTKPRHRPARTASRQAQ